MSSPTSDLEFSEDDVSSLQLKMHINTVLAVLSNSLAVYLIVFSRGSRSMGHYKWYLLNIVVGCYHCYHRSTASSHTS